MNVIVCAEENMGMLFNGRRVSRDKAVIRKIAELVGEKRLWINQFSEEMFEGVCPCSVDSDFLNKAGNDDFCFVENVPLLPYEKRIGKIILFRWNRRYPSDVKLDISLEELKLSAAEDFKGDSHEKITMEVYVK